jgi:hypothetical protein
VLPPGDQARRRSAGHQVPRRARPTRQEPVGTGQTLESRRPPTRNRTDRSRHGGADPQHRRDQPDNDLIPAIGCSRWLRPSLHYPSARMKQLVAVGAEHVEVDVVVQRRRRGVLTMSSQPRSLPPSQFPSLRGRDAGRRRHSRPCDRQESAEPAPPPKAHPLRSSAGTVDDHEYRPASEHARSTSRQSRRLGPVAPLPTRPTRTPGEALDAGLLRGMDLLLINSLSLSRVGKPTGRDVWSRMVAIWTKVRGVSADPVALDWPVAARLWRMLLQARESWADSG